MRYLISREAADAAGAIISSLLKDGKQSKQKSRCRIRKSVRISSSNARFTRRTVRTIQKISIEGKLPSLNDYIRAERANRQAGAKLKRDTEELIMWQMGRLFKIKTPCFICFEWHEKTTRRDKDNVAFAKKFILDAMQKAEKLANDNNKCLIGFTDTFVYDKQYGVNLTIWEDGDGNKSI